MENILQCTAISVKCKCSKWQPCKNGPGIGKAGINDEGQGGRVDFILMKESDNVNPESWLRR